MHNIKDRQYEQFTSPERINLTVAALARGDVQEADRLWDTCPRHDYKAPNYDFTIHMHAFMLLRMEFREKCFYHFNMIKLIEARILYLECFIESKNFEVRVNKLSEIQLLHISRLKAVFEALKKFCGAFGLCFDDFLKNCHVEETCWDIDLYLSWDVAADIEYIDCYEQTFVAYWRD